MHKPKFTIANNKGLTLLELLLIIIILAILATVTLTAYQKRSVISKVEKAAIEMEGILQAASSFYILSKSPNPDNTINNWPAFEGPTDSMPDYFVEYLPVLQPTTNSPVRMINPWGKPYIVDGSQADKFKIQTETSSNEIAKTLAGKLPFAGIDTNNNKIVYSYVPTPGNNLGVNVQAIGIAKHNDLLPIPKSCVFGTTPQIAYGINYIRTNLKDILINSEPGANSYVAHVVGAPISYLGANITEENNSWRVNLSFAQASSCTDKKKCIDIPQGEGNWDGKDVEAQIMYVIFCAPPVSIPK